MRDCWGVFVPRSSVVLLNTYGIEAGMLGSLPLFRIERSITRPQASAISEQITGRSGEKTYVLVRNNQCPAGLSFVFAVFTPTTTTTRTTAAGRGDFEGFICFAVGT